MVGLIAITSIFSQSLNSIQAVAASVFVAIFLAIPLAILKILLSKGKRLKMIGIILSVGIVVLSWYMILTVAALIG